MKIKLLTLLAKLIGLAAMTDLTPVAPKYGAVLFMGASIAKDAINRLGDMADDGQANNSFKP